jgi:hypothetical protein
VRVITNAGSRKVSHVRAGAPRAFFAQVDGRRWLSLEGTPVVSEEPARVAEAVRRYAQRYRTPSENPRRVVLKIIVDRVLEGRRVTRRRSGQAQGARIAHTRCRPGRPRSIAKLANVEMSDSG